MSNQQSNSGKFSVMQLWKKYKIKRERKKIIKESNIASKIFNTCVKEIEENQTYRNNIFLYDSHYDEIINGIIPINLIWKLSPKNIEIYDKLPLNKRGTYNDINADGNEIAKDFSKNGPFYYKIKNSQFKGYRLVGKGGWQLFPFGRYFYVRMEKIKNPWWKFWFGN